MSCPSPLRVLLLEPASSQRELACALLQAAGFHPMATAAGEQALALSDTFQPQAILTELILPDFSGLEFIRRYRSRQGQAKLWAVTSASGAWAADAALKAGADFLFYKPVNWPELTAHLKSLSFGAPLSQVENALARLGLDPRRTGFSQTARCALLLGQNDGLLLKEAYLQVAREYRTSPTAVSRNVERCIQCLRGSPLLPARLAEDLSGKDFLTFLAQGAIIPL